MLHKLNPDRFPANKYMRVKELDKRPKQDNGIDCGVYVFKYIDAILNGINLGEAYWDPKLTILTFRYRIAHEIKNGEARQMSEWSMRQRLKGL